MNCSLHADDSVCVFGWGSRREGKKKWRLPVLLLRLRTPCCAGMRQPPPRASPPPQSTPGVPQGLSRAGVGSWGVGWGCPSRPRFTIPGNQSVQTINYGWDPDLHPCSHSPQTKYVGLARTVCSAPNTRIYIPYARIYRTSVPVPYVPEFWGAPN